MHHRRVGGAAATLAMCVACGGGGGGTGGLDLGLGGFGCYIGGVAFEGNRPGEFMPLAVGETQVFSVVVGPPSSMCDATGMFTHLEWVSDLGRGETNTGARLVACEACTVLYEGRPAHGGIEGAARLHALKQRVHFEVSGLKPGSGSLVVFACFDEFCTHGADDSLSFRISAAAP